MSDIQTSVDLDCFVVAQQSTYEQALAEVRRGAKRSHWMWFIFPQFDALASSEMSRRYAIRSLDEARAYLAHPLLGMRYRKIVATLQDLDVADATAVFGPVDAQKLRSSLTLFAMVSEEPMIGAALERWFGAPDFVTQRLAR